MAKSGLNPSKENSAELKAFINDNAERVVSFCYFMLPSGAQNEDLVLDIFREFGSFFRSSFDRRETWQPLEVKIQLFQMVWRRIRDHITSVSPLLTVGRDTRQLKGFDDDLLARWEVSKQPKGEWGGLSEQVAERLRAVDSDFRAPLVLRDLLAFEDEEVIRILGLRWGVYRHRLHRGRIDLSDGLRGRGGYSPKEASAKEKLW